MEVELDFCKVEEVLIKNLVFQTFVAYKVRVGRGDCTECTTTLLYYLVLLQCQS